MFRLLPLLHLLYKTDQKVDDQAFLLQMIDHILTISTNKADPSLRRVRTPF